MDNKMDVSTFIMDNKMNNMETFVACCRRRTSQNVLPYIPKEIMEIICAYAIE